MTLNLVKSKSIKKLEEKMAGLDGDSLRYHILESAKSFKTSWVELGRALYTVSKDKLYKEWGYGTIEAYTLREIGIRKETAMKLLRSYYFLEKEEPAYLTQDQSTPESIAKVPSYESVDLLRKVKNRKDMDPAEYQTLKKAVFESGKDAPQLRKDLTAMMRQRQELEPEEAREKRKFDKVRRFLGILRSLKEEIEISKMVSAKMIDELDSLIKKLEDEIT